MKPLAVRAFVFLAGEWRQLRFIVALIQLQSKVQRRQLTDEADDKRRRAQAKRARVLTSIDFTTMPPFTREI